MSSARAVFHAGIKQICGTDMPVFLYDDYTYNPEDPENGLFQGPFLVCVGSFNLLLYYHILTPAPSIGSNRHFIWRECGQYQGRKTGTAAPAQVHRGDVRSHNYITAKHRIRSGSGE